MKYLPFLMIALLASCSQPEAEITGSQLSLDEASPNVRAHFRDTVVKHPYEIPYWKWTDENAGFKYLEPGLTKLRFSNFTFKIDGKMWRMEAEREDTLTISEDVGHYLEGRNMWIESQDTSDRFELFMSVQQRIQEQYDYRVHDHPDFDWEKWDKEKVKLDIRSDYYRVRDSSGFFKLSWVHTDGDFFSDRFRQNHDFTDTTRHIDGEMGGSNATFFINNQFCIYWNDFAMFKIMKTAKDGTVSNHFFKLWYSYGC